MSYLLAFLGFAALIILHEFGHFLAAKAVGMRVERFSLFFGPMLLKFRRGETEYGVGPIPLGGYVRITGMNPRERLPEEDRLEELRARREQLARDGGSPDVERRLDAEISDLEDRVASARPRAYYAQPVWKRVLVILAGPTMNLLIAFFLIWGIFWSQGIFVGVTHGHQKVWQVEGALTAPASNYLKDGDVLLSVDGHSYPSEHQLETAVNSHRCAGRQTDGCQATTPATLVVKRHGSLVTLSIHPHYDGSAKRMRIGFGYVQAERHRALGPASSAGHSVSQMWYVTHTTVSTVVRIFEPKERKQLHGVVGGFKVTQERFAYSTVDALYTLALISLSLAVINLFPFLPLDGGHVFWALAEKVGGRRIPVEVMERASAVGFALILIVFVIGLSNDISTLAGSGFNAR
ncbi:MAG: site-2 protease family protein [Solirubrobacterales bacterium]|nr:site-2 protease family protein [Solirubrobacterales bacterium]